MKPNARLSGRRTVASEKGFPGLAVTHFLEVGATWIPLQKCHIRRSFDSPLVALSSHKLEDNNKKTTNH